MRSTAALTQPEFTLITLSQLPALSILLKDSMATPPGHVSLFGIAQKKKMSAGLGPHGPVLIVCNLAKSQCEEDSERSRRKKKQKKRKNRLNRPNWKQTKIFSQLLQNDDSKDEFLQQVKMRCRLRGRQRSQNKSSNNKTTPFTISVTNWYHRLKITAK